MRRLPVRSDPLHILWHYANGRMPDFVNKSDGPVGWVRWSHRGVQPLDEITFPDSQKRYIFSKKFTLRINTAFEEVIRQCADPTRFGKTWITPPLVEGLIRLNKMGHAHSFEAWTTTETPELAGGLWGVQIGSFITASSMFHKIPNATKAAYGQTLLHLKQRGFTMVDTGMVPDHMVNYGSRYIPAWQFEQQLRHLITQPRSITDGIAPPLLPKRLTWTLPAARIARALRNRLGFQEH
ncbi:MAG: leucyl/phenylalanyl-tRNA/protein transferase [Phycisphaerales bacterium]|nr:leucyl/phenylalanyl-tRNA/protein transferase [Phycisphaerales bacterium]